MILKSVLAQYDESSRKPIVKELRYSVNGRFSFSYGDSAFITRYLKIHVIFDKSMDHTSTKINGSYGQVLQLVDLGNRSSLTSMPTSGSWDSTYQEYDTFITDIVELDVENIGYIGLIIGRFKDEYGNEITPYRKKSALEVSRRTIIYDIKSDKYLKTGKLKIYILAPVGQKARFSLNKQNWTNYQDFDENNEINALIDISNTSIGGTSSSYIGRLHIDVDSTEGVRDQTFVDFVYNTAPISAPDILVENREGDSITETEWQGEDQPVLKFKKSGSLIAIDGFAYGIDTAPVETVDVSQASVIDAGCLVVPNIKTSTTVSLSSQFEVKKVNVLKSQFEVEGVNRKLLYSQFEINEIYNSGNCWYFTSVALRSQFNIGGAGVLGSQFDVLIGSTAATQVHLKNQFNVQAFGIAIKKGYYYINSNKRKLLPYITAIEGSEVSNYRKDLVYLTMNDGAINILKGTATSITTPVAPSCPIDSIPLAEILVYPGSSSISECYIEDTRKLYTPVSLLGNKLVTGQHEVRVKAKDVIGNWSSEGTFDIYVETDTPNIEAVSGIDYISGTAITNSQLAVMSNTCYLSWDAPTEYGTAIYYVTTDGTLPTELDASQSETGLYVNLPGAGIYEIKIRPKTQTGWGQVKIFTIEKAQTADETDGYIIFSEDE